MLKLIDGWRLWWRRWSSWLAALFATVVATITANPHLFVGLLALFPGGSRYALAGALFAICLIVPIITVHLKQRKLEDAHDGK